MRQLQPERKTYTMPLKISCRSTSRSRPPGSAGSDQWRNQRPLGVGQITGVGGPGRPESPFGHGPIYPKMALSHTLLIPNVTLIEVDAMTAKQRAVLVLEREAPVMNFLICDVFNHAAQ